MVFGILRTADAVLSAFLIGPVGQCSMAIGKRTGPITRRASPGLAGEAVNTSENGG